MPAAKKPVPTTAILRELRKAYEKLAKMRTTNRAKQKAIKLEMKKLAKCAQIVGNGNGNGNIAPF